MNALAEIQAATDAVSDRIAPSLVAVDRGTGIVVAPDRVLTSAHVLRRERPLVTTADGRRVESDVLAVDPDADLAVLAAEVGDQPPLELVAAPDDLRPGRPVFALANPGGRGVRVTFGVVSALDRSFRGPRGRRVTATIEHSAPLSRGSGGGPVVDADGRVLGLNTVRLDGGLILALRLDDALAERISALVRGERRSPTTLGVAVAPPRVARRMRLAVGLPEREGLLVRRVAPDSPAERGGLRSGDLLAEADGRPLSSVDDLVSALDAASGPLALTVVRGVDEQRIEVPLEPVTEAAG